MNKIKIFFDKILTDKHLFWSRIIFDMTWAISYFLVVRRFNFLIAFMVTSIAGIGKELIDRYYKKHPDSIPKLLKKMGIHGTGFDMTDIKSDFIGAILGVIDITILLLIIGLIRIS